jgi:hypothetical protein
MATNERVTKYHDALDDALDRPIAYNPAFRRITGSTVAGIFLSQAWYWSKRHKDDEGWFYKIGTEWEEETGLSRSEQETARKHCLRVGVMEEKLKGVPATMYYRVIKSKVYELLGVQFAETPQTEIVDIPQTGLDDVPQFAGCLQCDGYSNINKVTKTPATIPPVLINKAPLEHFTGYFGKFNSVNEIERWQILYEIIGKDQAEALLSWAFKKEIHMMNRAGLLDSLETAAKNWKVKPVAKSYGKQPSSLKSSFDLIDSVLGVSHG